MTSTNKNRRIYHLRVLLSGESQPPHSAQILLFETKKHTKYRKTIMPSTRILNQRTSQLSVFVFAIAKRGLHFQGSLLQHILTKGCIMIRVKRKSNLSKGFFSPHISHLLTNCKQGQVIASQNSQSCTRHKHQRKQRQSTA